MPRVHLFGHVHEGRGKWLESLLRKARGQSFRGELLELPKNVAVQRLFVHLDAFSWRYLESVWQNS